MTRIFPTYTYGSGPREHCYWSGTVPMPEYPAATGPITCDVAVIGAGFTGLSAALHLAEAGRDIVVLDAQTPGWGASGRNGGFCCLGGSAASDTILAKLYGETARREFRSTEHRAVDLAADLIRRHNIDCDVHSEGETLMAHSQKAMDGFEAKAKEVERDFGVTPVITARTELAASGMQGPFFGAMTTPIGFALNPMKYTLGLANAATCAGARIFAHSPVQRIDQQGNFTLTTPSAQITAKRLIVATNGYSSDDLPRWLRARYLPTQSNVIVTRPMSEEELNAQGWTSNQMSFDDRFLLHYFRLMPNNQMLFGMRGGLVSSAAADARMYRLIRRHFEAMFPAWAGVDTPYTWQGLLSISRDLTPYAGPIPEMPGAFTALSYHGNGVAMASYAGALLADQVLGQAGTRLHPKIMQSAPKRFPLGRFRRATIWPLYAGAVLMGK
ncbi:FAD-binding oxidoreductase [uncultured Roseovarius sp.]|uniref:NAD(P)/FAD-dependent oxidoreductase n=1 Tax=uncultured Roseovarius sp. TaxID=293344 RepID=UPI00262D1A99|nr:FAD-dependent oxidoreductase [uncultured Roseovarius sp.]